MKTMEYEGYKLKLVRSGDCYGCFFANKASCPECGNGKWIIDGNAWHTGTPTEEGWYLIAFNYEFEEGVRYATDYFKDGKWAFPMVRDISKLRAWQRIEPYEEASE